MVKQSSFLQCNQVFLGKVLTLTEYYNKFINLVIESLISRPQNLGIMVLGIMGFCIVCYLLGTVYTKVEAHLPNLYWVRRLKVKLFYRTRKTVEALQTQMFHFVNNKVETFVLLYRSVHAKDVLCILDDHSCRINQLLLTEYIQWLIRLISGNPVYTNLKEKLLLFEQEFFATHEKLMDFMILKTLDLGQYFTQEELHTMYFIVENKLNEGGYIPSHVRYIHAWLGHFLYPNQLLEYAYKSVKTRYGPVLLLHFCIWLTLLFLYIMHANNTLYNDIWLLVINGWIMVQFVQLCVSMRHVFNGLWHKTAAKLMQCLVFIVIYIICINYGSEYLFVNILITWVLGEFITVIFLIFEHNVLYRVISPDVFPWVEWEIFIELHA